MEKDPNDEMDTALDWCTSVLGPVEVLSDSSKLHGGHESTTCRLHAQSGFYYLKIHQSPSNWDTEVHAYERWAPAFGDHAPRLLAARAEGAGAVQKIVAPHPAESFAVFILQ